MEIPEHTIIETKITEDGQIIDYCRPKCIRDYLAVYCIGDTFEVISRGARPERGVNMKAIRNFNIASGAYIPDEEAEKAESKRVGTLQKIAKVNELASCNTFEYFVTITLSPEKWNRYSPEKLPETLREISRKWKRLQRNSKRPYKDFAYLAIPEKHEDGAIHIHALMRKIPPAYLVEYTEIEKAETKLPYYIIDCLKKGQKCYHCTVFDEIFGWNIIEKVKSRGRIANYITKYIVKCMVDCEKLPFKTLIWHTRGLKTKEKVAEYAGKNRTSKVRCKETMIDLAVTDKNNQPLVKIYEPKHGEHRTYMMTAKINEAEHQFNEINDKILRAGYERLDEAGKEITT